MVFIYKHTARLTGQLRFLREGHEPGTTHIIK